MLHLELHHVPNIVQVIVRDILHEYSKSVGDSEFLPITLEVRYVSYLHGAAEAPWSMCFLEVSCAILWERAQQLKRTLFLVVCLFVFLLL